MKWRDGVPRRLVLPPNPPWSTNSPPDTVWCIVIDAERFPVFAPGIGAGWKPFAFLFDALKPLERRNGC